MANIKQYRVKSLAVNSTSGRVFTSGEKVGADAFPEGHAEKLLADGHLEAWYEKKTDLPSAGTVRRQITQEDLDAQPELEAQGLKVGDEYEFQIHVTPGGDENTGGFATGATDQPGDHGAGATGNNLDVAGTDATDPAQNENAAPANDALTVTGDADGGAQNTIADKAKQAAGKKK